MDRLDWDDLGILLAVAREGSLRLAAEKLRLSAATASRRLSKLEAHLGEVLVERAEDGCELTPFGNEVVAWAKAMEQAAAAIERLREAQNSESLGGLVRINADEWTIGFLASRTAAFHQRFPNMELQLVATGRPLSLARRDADLAIRKRLPEDGQLRVRRVGTMAYGLYAAESFLERHGGIAWDGPLPESFAGLDILGQEEASTTTPAAAWLGRRPDAATPRLRCNQVSHLLAAVGGGAGLAVLAHHAGDRIPGLRCLLPRIGELDEELWVVVHEALTGSARIRVVSDFLAELFRRDAGLLRGEQMRSGAGEPVPLAS